MARWLGSRGAATRATGRGKPSEATLVLGRADADEPVSIGARRRQPGAPCQYATGCQRRGTFQIQPGVTPDGPLVSHVSDTPTQACAAGEDLVSGLDPDEGLGTLVPGTDPVADVCFQG